MKNKKSGGDLPARVTGKQGGEATLKKYGKDHYARAAKKRWEKERKRKKEVSA